MQPIKRFGFAFLAITAANLLATHGAEAKEQYGPRQCVSIERSQAGSCVFKTECKGVDLNKFEFAFVCGAADGSSRKHSFGLGGFDEEEEYDTEVKCASCLAPLDVKPEAKPAATPKKKEGAAKAAAAEAQKVLLAGKGNAATASATTKKQAGPTKEEIFQVVEYGPSNCVSTYPSKAGTCILKTDCKEKALDGYALGLVCADQQGEMVRHMFGADSFHHKETFDTLIPCAQCLSLDNFDSGKDTEEAVLKDEVETLKSDFNALNGRVTKLEKAEEKPAKAEEPKAEAKAEEPKAEEKAFLAAKRHQHTAVERVPRRAKKVHRKQEEEEQEDEEEGEDDDGDDEEQDGQEDADEDEDHDGDNE